MAFLRRSFESREMRANRVSSEAPIRASAVLVLIWAVIMAGCFGGKDGGGPSTDGGVSAGGGLPRMPLAEGTPIVFISIDTLRSDRLPFYGYDQVETPALSALREESILFESAYSHIPLTLPSHASLLTGLIPPDHGLRDNVGYSLDREAILSGELPYLPLALAQRGYATGAAVSSYVLRGKLGLEEGFDFYEDSIEFRSNSGLGGLQRPGLETLDLAEDWLRQAASGPFFFFFHIYEPHSPYRPPEPFASRYASAYDGEVAAADAVIGRLLDLLRELGVYDEALVILFSDHGEGLGDHGEEEHGVLLYRETIQVPLLLKLPAGELGGESVALPTQLSDIYPTLAQLVDLPASQRWRGQSLLSLMEEGAPRRRIYSETFYPRLHFGWSELSSISDGSFHYIEGPDPELYDLVQDFRQTNNVLESQRRVFAELREELGAYDRELEPPAEVDDESREALAALGYIGSVAAVGDGPLPDPKTRLETLTDLKEGFQYHSSKEYEQAVAAFERALEENPQMLDAWEFLARSLQKLGRSEEALAAYRRALEISSGAPNLAISAASLFFDLGKMEDAEAHARLALASHPSFAHGLLAQIALAGKNLEEAERQALLAMDEKKPRLGPRITLAGVRHAQGELEESSRLIAETEAIFAGRSEKDPDLIQGLYLLKGQILADLGDSQGAEAAFLREMELFPRTLSCYSNLALLYALTGRPQDSVAMLRRMVEEHPSADSYAEAVRTFTAIDQPAIGDALLRHALGLFPNHPSLQELRRPRS